MCGFFGPRVRDNADVIIEAQVKEIEQMELLLEDIEANVEMVGEAPLNPRTAELTPSLRAEAEAVIAR